MLPLVKQTKHFSSQICGDFETINIKLEFIILKPSKMKSPGPDNYTGEYECEMWDVDHKESWALKNWWFWTVVLEKTLESPLDCKEIQPVHPKGNQSWMFMGRTGAETPIFWPPDVKNWIIWKKPWCWERLKVEGKGDNRGWDGWMASPTQWTWVWVDSGSWWWTGLACCSSWGHKELNTTGWLNWTELNWNWTLFSSF